MHYKDDFFREYSNEVSFHEQLYEINERGDWIRVISKNLKVFTADGNQSTCKEIPGEDVDKVFLDTKKHTGLLIQSGKDVYMLGSTAIATLKGRARIEGMALSDIPLGDFALILNKCLQVAKGKALLRYSEGKVRAVLSGDTKDYAILSMPEVFMIASAYINNDYQSAEFINGYIDHSMSMASWDITDQSLSSEYKALFAKYEKSTDGTLTATIRVRSSDTGASGANIYYSLRDASHTIVLGEVLKVKHKNMTGIEDFTRNIEQVYDYFKKALKDISKLCNIKIRYPVETMKGVMAAKGFPKKLTHEVSEQFRAITENKPCTAYDVYAGISESLIFTKSKQKEVNAAAMVQLEERIARCMSVRWQDYDIPGTDD